MVKRMLWKDIRQTLSKSKGRVVSIVCLMALGSFALVGLKVTGPDMQATAAGFYGRNNLADITVVSNYGISKDDERIIGKADGIKEVNTGTSRTWSSPAPTGACASIPNPMPSPPMT
mgnify:FL=1